MSNEPNAPDAESVETVLDRPREVFAPFDAREARRLDEFVADVETFATSSFFNRPSVGVTLGWQGAGHPLTTALDYAGEEAVRAVVPVFRQLYAHNEPTSMVTLFNLLAEHVRARGGPLEDEALAALKEFRVAQRQVLRGEGGPALILNDRRLTPEVLIDLFLHGHYLHKGNEKSDQLAEWPLSDVTKHTFFVAMDQLRRLYWNAANVVRRILACSDLVDVGGASTAR